MSNAKPNALVIGSRGGIGQALVTKLNQSHQVFEINQANCDYSEDQLGDWAVRLGAHSALQTIICSIGTLHGEGLSPEKKLSDINATQLAQYYRINTILPALCLRYFAPLLDKQSDSSFACLSAMVGSIGENQLGGWYGYRSSKAALNMLVKNAAIEIKRSNKQAAIVAIHPGTTKTRLSQPFSARLSKDNYYTAAQSAERIVGLTLGLSSAQTGHFYNWDGREIAW